MSIIYYDIIFVKCIRFKRHPTKSLMYIFPFTNGADIVSVINEFMCLYLLLLSVGFCFLFCFVFLNKNYLIKNLLLFPLLT